jgi:hypothetical protein
MYCQKPQQLLQAWENQAFVQWKFCSLFAGCRLPGAQESSTADTGKQSLLACTFCFLSMEQQKPWGMLTLGYKIPWNFRVWGSRSCSRRDCGALSSYISLRAELNHWEQQSGVAWTLWEWGIRSVELWVLLPIPPMVSCFSICGFREDFAFCWLWNPMGSWSSFFRVVCHHWGLEMSTICHLAQPTSPRPSKIFHYT